MSNIAWLTSDKKHHLWENLHNKVSTVTITICYEPRAQIEYNKFS